MTLRNGSRSLLGASTRPARLAPRLPVADIGVDIGGSDMRARIYKPARSTTQSGTGRTRDWVLEFVAETPREIDPLTGWTSSADTQAQVRLRFADQAAAEDYARERGIDYVVLRPQRRKANLRAMGYGENFRTDRRGAWTH
jgi:hypothetical protein